MSKPKFTPGLWEVASGMVQTVAIHTDCKLTPGFCDVHTPIAWMDRKPGNGTMPTERDANAQLVACAPEMLDILLEFIQDVQSTGPNVAEDWPDLQITYEHAQAIITKAQGGQS